MCYIFIYPRFAQSLPDCRGHFQTHSIFARKSAQDARSALDLENEKTLDITYIILDFSPYCIILNLASFERSTQL
jgi:hypothetical protein